MVSHFTHFPSFFHLFPILVHGDHVQNTSTDNTELVSAYLTPVHRQPVVGEEHDATAGLDLPGRNAETTTHEYVEGWSCP